MLAADKKLEDGTLETVAKKLEYWRAHRKARGPIPPKLLRAVYPLLQFHTLGWLCQALRINYNTLKKLKGKGKMPSGNTMSIEQPKGRPAAFVEIQRSSPARPIKPASSELPVRPGRMEAIEFETPRGYKARIFTSHDLTDRIEGMLNLLFVAGR